MRALLFSFLFIPYALFSSDLEERVKALESEIKFLTKERRYSSKMSHRSSENEWIGVSFTGDFLYWHTKIGGTEIAYQLVMNSLGIKEEEQKEKQNFSWDFGFRASLSLNFPKVAWDILAKGTYYHTQDLQNESKKFQPPLLQLKGDALIFEKQTTNQTDILYENLNIESGNHYTLGRFLNIRTLVGVKWAAINQSEIVKYNFSKDSIAFNVKDNCDFLGIGPRIGVGTKWNLFYGVHFSLDLSTSILYAGIDTNHKEQMPTDSHFHDIDIGSKAYLFCPTADLFLGLAWNLDNESSHFLLSIGYEVEYFWRENQSLRMEDKIGSPTNRLQIAPVAENITFYGATLKGRLSF